MSVKVGEISFAYSLRNHEGILSGPLASEVSFFGDTSDEDRIIKGFMLD